MTHTHTPANIKNLKQLKDSFDKKKRNKISSYAYGCMLEYMYFSPIKIAMRIEN